MKHDSFETLDETLRRDAAAIGAAWDGGGRVAAAVRARLDAGPSAGDAMRSGNRPWLVPAALLAAAALVLFVLGPRRALEDAPAAPAPANEASLAFARPLERMGPASVLRALFAPLSGRADEEAAYVVLDLERVARGFGERIPTAFGKRIAREVEAGLLASTR